MGEDILKAFVLLSGVLVGALVVHLNTARLDRNRRTAYSDTSAQEPGRRHDAG